MPHDPIERVNPFRRTYRHLRSFAQRVGNDLCRAMERWFLDHDIPVGGQR